MTPKKNILILDSIQSDGTAVSVIEKYLSENYSDFNVVVLDEAQYGSKTSAERSCAMREKYMQKMPVLYRKVKTINNVLSGKNVKVKERSPFKKKLRGAAKRIYNAVLRFDPEVLFTSEESVLREAVIAKIRTGFKNPILVLLNRYTVDRSFYSPYVDAYIVENPDMKNQLTSLGFPSAKVFVLGLPVVENMPAVDYIVRKKSHLGLNMNPTVYLYGGKVGSREMFPVFELLLDQGNMINIIADCGKNLGMHSDILKLIDERKAQNVKVYFDTDKASENTLIAADCVMTVFDSELIYRSFLLNIPVVAYAPDNASEEADLLYLESKNLIYYAHDYNFAVIGLYKILQTNLGKRLSDAAAVRTSPRGLEEICALIADFKARIAEQI